MSKGLEGRDSGARERLYLALLSDRALTPEEWGDDAFGLENRLGAIKDSILLKDTQTPVSIMITGRWGTGKTSAMAWMDGALTNKETTLPAADCAEIDTCWFHPWKYQEQEDVWRGLIAEIILCICDRRKLSWSDVKQITAETVAFLGNQALNFMAAAKLRLGNPKGTGAEMSFEKPIAQLKEDADALFHPQNAHLNYFESTLTKWMSKYYPEDKRRLVVFIDDLDRCMPKVALQVLEALKLYLNIKNLVFVAGVDRGILDEIIQKNYCDLVSEGANDDDFKQKAAQYLDKMFQLEVNIEPDEKQIAVFFEEKIVPSPAWESLPQDDAKLFRLVILSLCKRVPRAAVRLVNKIALAWGRWASQSEITLSQALQAELIEVVAETEQKGLGSMQKDDEGQRFLAHWSRIITSTGNPVQRIPKGERMRRLRLISQEELDEIGPSDKGRVNLEHLVGAPKETTDKPAPKFDHLAPLLHPKYLPYEALLGSLSMSRLLNIPYPEGDLPALPLPGRRPSQFEIEFLLQWLAEIQGIDPEDLDVNEVLSSKDLDISGSGVENIDPVQWLTELTSLNASGASYSDLTPLAKLTNLKALLCTDTQVSDLSPLSGLTSLQTLNCYNTQVSDLSPLSGLTSLQALSCYSTQVSDLFPLSGLTSLQTLNCTDTKLSDLSPLSSLTSLKLLSCGYTQVSDLSSISDLTELIALMCNDTLVSDLSPLSDLMALELLWCDNTQVSDLSPLSGLTSLQTLFCGGTKVSDLSPLSGLTSLQTLDCEGTQVSDLSPLSGLTSLQTLDCRSTKVTKGKILTLRKALPNCKIIHE